MKTCVNLRDSMAQSKATKISTIVFTGFLILCLHHCACQVVNIDNRFLVTPNDCYTRLSIGSRLADSSVTWTTQANSVSDCEAACSANGTSCGAFSFGVGLRGNGTCLFATSAPQRRDLVRNDDYDVYQKGKVSLYGCRSLRSRNTSSAMSLNKTQPSVGSGDSRSSSLNINGGLFSNSSIFNTLGNFKTRNRNSSRPSTFSLDPADDDLIRISDILQNKRGPEEESDKNIYNFPEFKASLGLPQDYVESFDSADEETSEWGPEHRVVEDKNSFELFGKRILPTQYHIGSPVFKEQSFLDDDDFPSGIEMHSDFGQKINVDLGSHNFDSLWWDLSSSGRKESQPLFTADVADTNELDGLGKGKACFRRLFEGRRIVDAYVRRAMECDRLPDCHRMCEYERGFTCEGFNYRSQLSGKSICELTSMPPNRVDKNRDFDFDHRYDFYERDWRKCSRTNVKAQPYPPQNPMNWWRHQPSRPHWIPEKHRGSYGPPAPRPLPPSPPSVPGPAPYGGSFDENTQLTLDIPKPIDPSHRRPGSIFNPEKSWVNPEDVKPLPVRPLEDFYPPANQKPPSRPRPHDVFYHDREPPRGYSRPYPPFKPDGFEVHNGNGYSYGRPINRWSSYPHRRVGYLPNTETNEVAAPYTPDRKPPKHEGWDTYGYSYAHGYHTHHVGPPKHPPPPRDHFEPRPYPPKPTGPHDSYPDTYGAGYGYTPALPPKPHPPTSQCSVRSAAGFKLTRGIIRKSYLTPNVEQCESLCENQEEFTCRTFAYRYSLATTSPADNCLQSDAVFDDLVFYTDLEPNRDYDIYAMLGSPKWCNIQPRPMTNSPRPRPPDECFWRVRSGFAMPPAVVKKPTRVEGMGECQVHCVSSQDFTCRSFVFRYETYPVHGVPNCFMSDWPAMEIDPHGMQDMDGAEMYERGSFGRGCEPQHPLPPPPPPLPSHPPDRKRPPSDDVSCYAGYDRPCKLMPYAIILAMRVDAEADCRQKCSAMRRQDVSPCMGYNFKIDNNHHGENCYLSDIPTRDLRPGLDYVHDDDYVLFVWKDLEPKCFMLDDRAPPFRPTYGREPTIPKPYARPDDPYYHEIIVPDPNKPNTPPGDPNCDDDFHEKFLFPIIPHEMSIFGRFTVSGHPCRRGTACERNPVMGFWSCEPEGAEAGAWEYCCEPSHHCGFSQGYKYPWCYVGASEDQWRPCSEKYFPYHLNPRPARPPISHSKSSYVMLDDDDYHSRHWPMTFLHGEGPPNGTDSVALANDIANRMTNNSSTLERNKQFNGTTYLSLGHGKRRRVENLSRERDRKQPAPVTFRPGSMKNRTSIKSPSYRLNSRYRPFSTVGNNSVEFSPRFSRDQSSGQYYITKKLNAKLHGEAVTDRPKVASVAKIERISRVSDFRRNNSSSDVGFITSSGSTTSKSVRAPPVSLIVVNQTTNSNTTKRWVPVSTKDKSDV